MSATISGSVEKLALLERVEGVHKEESENWFKSLLDLVGQHPLEDIPELFKAYEKVYKDTTGSTSMPTKYRSAKSVINKGLSVDLDMWTRDGKTQLWGKSMIEKEVKSLCKQQTPPQATAQGTIIKKAQEINVLLTRMDNTSKKSTATRQYLSNFFYYSGSGE